jgi:uncharacterized short protein YbdD (DUF466 family)
MRSETEVVSRGVATSQRLEQRREKGAVVPGRADAQWWRVRRVRRSWRAALAAVRQVVGAPDYGRYLEHHAACHPGETPMTPREYYADFVRRRFEGGPKRCC